MKKGLIILGMFFTVTTFGQNAESVLNGLAEAYSQSNGVIVPFAMHIQSEKQGLNESFEGELQLRDNKFMLRTPDVLTWFDGTTQWTYMVSTEEVNVSEPTDEELLLINPIMLLLDYKKGFKASKKGESKTQSGATAYDIVLTPKKAGNIKQVELQIEKSYSIPVSVVITAKDGMKNTIHIRDVSAGVGQPDSFFVFKESEYPDTEVIDLR